MLCKSCGSKDFVIDDTYGAQFCSSCGAAEDSNNYEHQFGGVAGPEGTFVRVDTSGANTNYSYKERKFFQSDSVISDNTFARGCSRMPIWDSGPPKSLANRGRRYAQDDEKLVVETAPMEARGRDVAHGKALGMPRRPWQGTGHAKSPMARPRRPCQGTGHARCPQVSGISQGNTNIF